MAKNLNLGRSMRMAMAHKGVKATKIGRDPKCPVSEKEISSIVNNERNLSVDKIEEISEYLDVCPYQFVAWGKD